MVVMVMKVKVRMMMRMIMMMVKMMVVMMMMMMRMRGWLVLCLYVCLSTHLSAMHGDALRASLAMANEALKVKVTSCWTRDRLGDV